MQLVAPFQNQFEIESHTNAATVYLRGSLSAASALGAVAACHSLPEAVRSLVVDLRGVRLVESDGLATLHHLLRRWRAARDGTIRVLPPLQRAA
jgi:anti-anti-sigma regulatory factor